MQSKLKPPMRKTGQPIWFELPNDRGNIDSVEYYLKEWASLHDVKFKDDTHARSLFLNSVIHGLECAFLLWLAPYAHMRGFDSGIFIDGAELAHYCNSHVFPNGYPLEMVEALSLCYSFEEPWSLSEEYANKYATELVVRLKDLALYSVEELEYLKVELKKHRSGRKKGALSEHKKFVRQFVSNNLQDASKVLWGQLLKALKIEDEACPLWSDGMSVFRKDNSDEYTFARFEKDVSEFRNSTLKIKNSSLP